MFYHSIASKLIFLFYCRIRVRAQNMFWGFEKWTPDWVLDLPTKEDLLEAMSARINGTMGNTTGLYVFW